jgi:hypothetical protein
MTLIPIFAPPPVPPASAAPTNNPSDSAAPSGGMKMPDGMVMPAHKD